jgi:hypothetical protein
MNLYHKTLILSLSLVLAGCSTMETRRTTNAALGRVPHYDAVEYDRAVNILITARQLPKYEPYILSLTQDVKALRTYTEGRPYNDNITFQVDQLDNVTQSLLIRLQSPIKMKPEEYKHRCSEIEVLADALRLSIGNEKL